MFVVVMLAQVVAFGVQPVVPLFVRELVGNPAWLATAVGLAFAVTGLADLVASPFLGKRSDRIGYRRVLLISLCGVAALTIPQAFASTIGAFIGLRFGVGLFLGGVLPTANALIGRIFPRERRGQVYRHHVERDVFGHVRRTVARRIDCGALWLRGGLSDDRRYGACEPRVGRAQRADVAGGRTDSMNARTKDSIPRRSASVKRACSGLSQSKTPANSPPMKSGTTISEREAASQAI